MADSAAISSIFVSGIECSLAFRSSVLALHDYRFDPPTRFFSNFDCKHVSSFPLWIRLLSGYGNSRGLQPATGLLAHDNDR